MKSRQFLKNVLVKASFLLLLLLGVFTAHAATILNEPLTSGSLPSGGWTQANITFQTSASGYAQMTQNTAVLTSPSYNLTGYTGVTLTYDVAKYGSGTDGYLTVQVSTDGGSTWTAASFSSPTPTSSTYKSASHTITTLSATTKFRWLTTTSPQSDKRLRNLLLVGTAPTSTITPNPTSYNFGSVNNGSTADNSFAITTSGLSASVSVTGTANFLVSSDGSNFSTTATIAQGGGTLYVRFAPTAIQTYGPTNITLTSGTASANISVQGTGISATNPEINLKQSSTTIASGGSYSYGSVNVGSSSGAVTFTIENTGNATLNLTGSPIVAKSGTNNGDFTIVQPASSTVAAGSSTTFTVNFTPGATGSRTAVITITNNDSNESTYTINLSGTGVAPEINLKQSSTSIASGSGSYNFGTITLGSSSSVTTFTVENLGTANLNLTGSPKVAISGTNSADFSINQSSTAATVAASGTTTFTVTFTPGGSGSRTASISISNNDSDENPYTFTLNGTGQPVCSAPNQATNLTLSNILSFSIDGSFTAASGGASGYLVVQSASSTLSSGPVNGVTYSAGGSLGGGTVVQSTNSTTFTASSLAPNTQYYFFVYAYNNTSCGNGPAYKSPALSNNATTTSAPFTLFDNFDRTASSTVGIPSSGGATAWSESEPLATQAEIYNNRMDINNRSPAGQAWTYFDMTGKYSTTFDNASGDLVWVFNMYQTRPDPSGFGSSNYAAAFVLGGTSSSFNSAGNGYAVALGQSGSTDHVRIVKYTGGLISGTLTDVVADAGDYGDNMLNIKVSYTPTTHTWKLYVVDDGSPSSSTFDFNNPVSASYGAANSATDNTYTSSDLKYSGGFWNYATSSGEYASFDNLSIPNALAANQVYTWASTSGSHDWTVSTSWTPVRTTPSATDILQFNLGGNSIATNVPTQTVGQITVSNNTTISLRAASGSTSTLTIQGYTGTDLSVAAGSSLIYDSNDPLEISLNSAATASISGNVTFKNTPGAGGPRDHRLYGNAASAITFNNGSVFTAEDLAGNPFGSTGTQNVVVFASGATYVDNDGANPFGLSQPASKVVFQANSNYKHTQPGSAPSLAGRTYGNLEFALAGATLNNNFGNATDNLTINGNLTITSGTVNFNLNGNDLPLNINVTGNVSVASGASFNFTPTNSTAKSTLKLNGSSNQTISGPGSYSFGKNSVLEIANNTGLSNINLGIKGLLKLTSGTLTTNGQQVTILSDASGTAAVQNGTGTVSGSVTVQRYVAGGSGYRYFSAPISDASIVDINDNVPLVGFAGTSAPSAFPNIYYYDETNTSIDSMQGWTAPTTLAPGYLLGVQRGWAVRMNGGVTVDLTGNLNNGLLSRTVTNTSSGRYTADGWNLVGNPYASPLNWDAVALGLPSQIDNAIYYWDPIGEQYAAYVNGAGTNGATKEVSSMQAFFIKVNTVGSFSLSTDNNARTTGDPTFFRTARVNNEMLTLTVNGAGHKDQTVVRFADNGTNQFDRTLDAYKRGSSSTAVPSLYTGVYSDNDGLQYAVNTLSSLTQETSVPLSMKSQVAGSYSINAGDLSSFDATSLVWLEDLQTGHTQDLRQNPVYTFTSTPADAAARFVLHFTPAVKFNTVASTCAGNDGSIEIDNAATSVNWICSVKDAQNNVVAIYNHLSATSLVHSLAKGDYTVQMNSNGYVVTKVIHVDGAEAVKAMFQASTIDATAGQQVTFSNQSTGNGQYTWSFGDGQNSTDQAPTHQYQYAGDYEVVLTVSNNQCTDSHTQSLKVSDVVNGINSADQKNTVIFADGNIINIEFANTASTGNVSIDVIDVMGRKVIATKTVDPTVGKLSFATNDIATGYYFVKVTGKGFDTVQKVFLGDNK